MFGLWSRDRQRAVELFGPAGTPRIAIIGCGFGGIGLAARLRKAGIHTFTVFEKNAGVGGTWYENTYPGAEVDSESHLYSFRFKTHNWTRSFSQQGELLAYLEETVAEFGLEQNIRLNTQIQSIVWSEEAHEYTVRTTDGVESKFHVVVSAVGLLNNPYYPSWDGLDVFEGPKFHTARWENHDLSGKRVAIVGTGSSAAQIIPAIADQVGQLDVYQREPGYVVPKNARVFSPLERAVFNNPLARLIYRYRCYFRTRKSRGQNYPIPGTKVNELYKQQAVGYLNETFRDRPDLRDAFTPQYAYPGKRVIISDTFYPSFHKKSVNLVAKAVSRVTEKGIVDSDGVERPADVLIMATGFQTANYLANLKVAGRKGIDLHATWNNEPKALLGTVVSGFPNFYMIYGPNSNGGEILFFEDAQIRYILSCVKQMSKKGVSAIEVDSKAMEHFNVWLQKRLSKTAFGSSVFGKKLGYYLSPTGRIVTQWNQGLTLFLMLSVTLPRLVSKISKRKTSKDAAAVNCSPVDVSAATELRVE
ncbi:flavin-containing monooxygenase [Pseudomonas fluorescens]|nr:NAD(P)/FAD-dependent oxidoreductase [Pseudomonas fluorescens]